MLGQDELCYFALTKSLRLFTSKKWSDVAIEAEIASGYFQVFNNVLQIHLVSGGVGRREMVETLIENNMPELVFSKISWS